MHMLALQIFKVSGIANWIGVALVIIALILVIYYFNKGRK